VAEYDGEKEAVGTRAILDIHESFHSFDPTGREGRPRDRFPKKGVAKKGAATKGAAKKRGK
jgi:hypothetical protein